MTDMADLSGLLEAERRRLKSRPRTAEQRARERLANGWWPKLRSVWTSAYLLSDEELQWLAAVTDATRDKPERVRRNSWTGRRVIMRAPPSDDDAVRLDKLQVQLSHREHEERARLRREGKRQVAVRLTRLGLDAERYADMDDYALIDRYYAERGAP
jgi:hypothetical protein